MKFSEKFVKIYSYFVYVPACIYGMQKQNWSVYFRKSCSPRVEVWWRGSVGWALPISNMGVVGMGRIVLRVDWRGTVRA